MSNILDYIRWRGDLLFSQDPPNEVDALIFSTLAYLRFDGSVMKNPEEPVTLCDASAEFFSLKDYDKRARSKMDLELLDAAAGSARFGNVKLCRYSDRFIPHQDTQFAAITFLLDDGSLYIAFRGTDFTLVGWKEDFNMCFQQTIPAQRLAVQYVREIYAEYSMPMRIAGHSKGGNLAVFAAARSSPMVQRWIIDVCNNDGPGFSDYMIGDPGYLAMIPKIHTFVPQSSLIGMIMDHEEPYTIVKSNQVSILQHDVFSWELQGKEFLKMERLTPDSTLFNKTIKNWLAGMTHEERNQMVDVLFDLLSSGDVDSAPEIFRLKNLRNYAKTLGNNETTRRVLADNMQQLLDAAKKARQQLNHKNEEQPKIPET